MKEVKTPIQFPRYLIRQTKSLAIQTMENYINENLNEFVDGEEIAIKYLNSNGGFSTVNAIVSIANNVATISVLIGEDDTLKIVAYTGSTPPEDKTTLWLTEEGGPGESGETTTGLTTIVNALRNELKGLRELVDKHEYALRNTIAGGDIITNSEKYDSENEYETEQPEDATDYEEYAESDFYIDNFDIYLGPVPFKTYYATTFLYKGQNYFLKFVFFNAEGEIIRPEDITNLSKCEIYSTNKDIADFKEGTTALRAEKQGSVRIVSNVTLTNGMVLSKMFDVHFEYNEEPYYKKYEEPNVHHLLIKSASSFDILTASTKYLCSPEFVWCEGNNTLYLKAKASNGTHQVFKISGTGSPITGDTGTTTAVTTYDIEEDGTLAMSGDTIRVDENGILELPGAVIDENGILNLFNITGSTTGDTGETGTRIVFNEETGFIEITSDDAVIDENGFLIIPQTSFNDDGYVIVEDE